MVASPDQSPSMSRCQRASSGAIPYLSVVTDDEGNVGMPLHEIIGVGFAKRNGM
jgi:hypothetical protein